MSFMCLINDSLCGYDKSSVIRQHGPVQACACDCLSCASGALLSLS